LASRGAKEEGVDQAFCQESRGKWSIYSFIS
jgi:hypothetical protein